MNPLLPICPLCNGLITLVKRCPSCYGEMEDEGKIENFYGPYSPYEDVTQLSMTNGFPDLAMEQCFHLAFCPACGMQEKVAIKEQHFL